MAKPLPPSLRAGWASGFPIVCRTASLVASPPPLPSPPPSPLRRGHFYLRPPSSQRRGNSGARVSAAATAVTPSTRRRPHTPLRPSLTIPRHPSPSSSPPSPAPHAAIIPPPAALFFSAASRHHPFPYAATAFLLRTAAIAHCSSTPLCLALHRGRGKTVEVDRSRKRRRPWMRNICGIM
ncbi:proline-rich receptor-like protein kinase PERK10 [Phoenix dactylifera]|uniref:Proline-rich receptor-like protein kinase PERK10 n=1 Tax=Phoenix dactylifera TaxID=42345 RepID=A0A8B8J078_PHODC|nr:proline-rich receptor-like protein kinase PERK10 [Phoenix dactylifera]